MKFEGEDPDKGSLHYIRSGIEFRHVSIAHFASSLAYQVNCPVVDETCLHDLFDIDLTYATKGVVADLNPPPHSAQSTIFEAIKRLGLKLESRPAKVTDYTVDHLERVPIEN